MRVSELFTAFHDCHSPHLRGEISAIVYPGQDILLEGGIGEIRTKGLILADSLHLTVTQKIPAQISPRRGL